MNKRFYSIQDFIKILDDIVETNYYNRKNNITNKNNSVEIIGVHGIGKSESIREYALKKGYAFEKRELAQITDETSLLGYPRKTIKIFKTVDKDINGEIKKVKQVKKIEYSDLSRYLADGWEQYSPDTELSYSVPEWVNNLYRTEKSILFLDELRRALPHIQSAVMNLINNGEYGDWKLPIGCTIVLANNPTDDGEYNVSSFDDACSDRMFRYYIKADIESWAQWASNHKIKEECINFMIKVPEALNSNDSPSLRMWTNFFNSISNKNLRSNDDLDLIYKLGLGSIGEEYTMMFKTFIDNNLDIIPSLNEIFSSKTKEQDAINKLKKAIIDKDTSGNEIMRTDIMGLLGLRIKTYLRKENITDSEINRFVMIIENNIIPKESLLDILMDVQKSDHPNKNIKTKLLSNSFIRNFLLESVNHSI